MPRFVVVRGVLLTAWRIAETVVVDTRLNGQGVGRRTLKRLDRHDWFVELPERTCKQFGVEVGARVRLSIELASTKMPDELATLVRSDPNAQRAWTALSQARRRMLREEVLAASRPETRVRRARCGLGLGPT